MSARGMAARAKTPAYNAALARPPSTQMRDTEASLARGVAKPPLWETVRSRRSLDNRALPRRRRCLQPLRHLSSTIRFVRAQKMLR